MTSVLNKRRCFSQLLSLRLLRLAQHIHVVGKAQELQDMRDMASLAYMLGNAYVSQQLNCLTQFLNSVKFSILCSVENAPSQN